MENIENQQNNQENKIEKEFNSNFKKLVALMGGEQSFQKNKVPNDEIGSIVKELLKEKREKIITEFKTKAIELLDKKLEFDKEVKKIEEEFKNKITNKKKEFNDKMKELFSLVEKIDEIEKSYYNSINESNEEV
ncbi:MAG: hypothetical protein QXL18_05080 [Candidatus Woesearchaeota archaeon]